MELLEGLNKSQKDAVTHTSGPLLIIAGAGTGKTTVITRRIAWLISTKKALPSEILALTFTDKAATEMEERVDELVPYGYVDTWISTFHAFGDRILRDHALDLGIVNDFKVLSDAEQAIFMSDNLPAFDLKYFAPLGNPTKHISALLSHFSRLKDEMISPQEYLEYLDKKVKEAENEEIRIEAQKNLEIARCYERYTDLMAETGNLDFGDLINLVIRLFRESPGVLKKYKSQFRYILVDEFQDTNCAQNELLKLLVGAEKNITVVGDDDQSIYRFRGAAISNILEFTSDYPTARQIVLTENYRSNQEILDSSYKLIRQNNPDRLEVKNNIVKKLISRIEGSGRPPVHVHFDTATSEADKVATIIKEKYDEGKYSFRDFAVLVRSKNAALPFIQALDHSGIPYKFSGLTGLYDRPEVRLLIHFARVLVNPGDDLAFFHLATSDAYNVSFSEVAKINEQSHKTKRSIESIAKKGTVDIEVASKESLERLLGDLQRLREESKDLTCGQVIYSFLKETGYLSDLVERAQDSLGAQVAIQNISKFFEKITEFEKISDDKSVVNFISHLSTLMNAGDNPATAEVDPDLEAVNVLTIHKSKGLEFPIVFMVALESGSFPSINRSEPLPIPDELIRETLPEGNNHMQEERRLFYVAMTRAKEELYLMSADDYGGKRAKKVSLFVLEALDAPALATEKVKLGGLETLKRFEKREKTSIPKKFYDGKSILVLNPHQIDDYLSCPKKFEYIHVLRVPIMTHHSVVYGSAVHKAIEEYFVRKKHGREIIVEDLYEVYDHSWRSEGFVTRQHEDQRYDQGKKSLLGFFTREEAANCLPDEVESKFEFRVDELNTKIRGRFDAVYDSSSKFKIQSSKLVGKSLPVDGLQSEVSHSSNVEDSKSHSPNTQYNIPNTESSANFLEIRDFKTSEVDTQKKADEKAKTNRQLSIYALAKWYETGRIPDVVSLYFVDSGLVGKIEKKEKDLIKTKDEIKIVADGIKKEDFDAKPGYQECSRCAYREICPFTLSK